MLNMKVREFLRSEEKMGQRNYRRNPGVGRSDIQNGDPPQGVSPIPHMESGSWVNNATKLIQGARDLLPVVFIKKHIVEILSTSAEN